PANAALVNGTKIFGVTNRTAGVQTWTVSDVSDSSKASATSSPISINAGAYAKLQLLVPGEAAMPGTATGKSGSPNIQFGDTAFNVIVNAVDVNWNLINTNDTIGFNSTDINAALPSNAPLVGGTKTFSLTLKTAGSWTITSTNTTHTSIA